MYIEQQGQFKPQVAARYVLAKAITSCYLLLVPYLDRKSQFSYKKVNVFSILNLKMIQKEKKNMGLIFFKNIPDK